MKRVRVVPYDEHWEHKFVSASEEVAAAVGENLREIHHIGSTSIPGIHAKPIIDMLAVAEDLSVLDEKQSQMEALGYEALGEFGIPGRRYFRRNDSSGERTEQVHAFQRDSPQILRHLAFRDYVRCTPDVATEYSNLKRRLAELHPNDIEAYMDGKDGFIKDAEAKALAWIDGTRIRTAARLILLDAAGRVLLFRYTEGFGRHWWGTPGGGVDPGETLRQAARREAWEELGLKLGELPFLWMRHAHFLFAGRPLSQTEAFFLVADYGNADHRSFVIDQALEETHRKECIVEARWWDPRELETTSELIFPEDLAVRLAGVGRNR
jgi:GrpB-like predicted nucleotidyltransferase (UPF0157 family)/8-oxo-dGTP pyrophosphatase MutT (NUDIX family)